MRIQSRFHTGTSLDLEPSGEAPRLSGVLLRVSDHLLRGDYQQLLLLLPAGLDGQDRLAVLVLDHLERDLRVPALVLRAPEVDLSALRHHHREVHVLPLALHAVHRLHVGEVQLLHLAAGVVVMVVVVFGWVKHQSVLGQHAALLLPQLQQPVAALLQRALLQHARAATGVQHRLKSRMKRACEGLGLRWDWG